MPGARVLFFFDAPVTLRRRLEERTAPMRGVSLRFSGDPGEILELAADADVLVGWRTTPDLLRAARRARLVVNPGAGVQHLVPIFRAHDRAIVLANGHGNAGLTAQHAVALLLALANQIVRHHGFMAAGRFRTGDAEGPSIPLRGRRIGLLGYGAVNRSVHRFLSGFDVSFHVLRRGARDGPTSYVAYGPADLAAFLDAVDTLVVAVPLTDETRGLLGAEEARAARCVGASCQRGAGRGGGRGSLGQALRDHIDRGRRDRRLVSGAAGAGRGRAPVPFLTTVPRARQRRPLAASRRLASGRPGPLGRRDREHPPCRGGSGRSRERGRARSRLLMTRSCRRHAMALLVTTRAGRRQARYSGHE
ncbi:MAG: NAD(P)-dependent oxidoreductase [Acidobacteriota bacterium]